MTMVDTFQTDVNGHVVIDKDPSAVLDYTFDWTDWLTDITDTIATATCSVDGATLDRQAVVGNLVAAWVSGGDEFTTARVTCQIVTAGGRTDERSIYLNITQR